MKLIDLEDFEYDQVLSFGKGFKLSKLFIIIQSQEYLPCKFKI